MKSEVHVSTMKSSIKLRSSVLISLAILTAFPILTLARVDFDNSWEDDPYHHIVNMDSKGDYVLEWMVDWTSRKVLFKIQVKTIGYIGFGITAKGKMLGADLILAGVNPNGKPYLYDMHVPESSIRQPSLDDSQDYTLISGWENGTHTSITFSREFETCDIQDYKINDDMIRFIWAYGRTDNITKYHYQFRGDYQTYILDPDYTPRVISEAKRTGRQLGQEELGDIKIWTMTRRQEMPAVDSAYWCSIHRGPNLDKKHHVIGVDFRYHEEIQYNHTHHVLVTRCRTPAGVDPVEFWEPFVQNNTGEMCFFLQRGDQGDGIPLQYCRDIFHAYSIGEKLFFLPDIAGMPLGENKNEYFLVQVHYDNPNRLSGITYDVNLDFYYTPNLREHDAGMTSMGHNIPGSPSILVPPMSQDAHIFGHCASECTQEMIPAEGITVIGVQQHTHYVGIRHRFRHFRGDTELPWIFNDDNYENKFQPTRHPRTEIKIMPGDQLQLGVCMITPGWVETPV